MKNLGYVLIKKDPNHKWDVYISKDAEMMQELLDFALPITAGHPLMLGMRKKQKCLNPELNIGLSKDITKFQYESDSNEQD